jgi:hypothetical protein
VAYISEALRQQVFQRARGLCEYCQTAQLIVVSMEIDHIVPSIAGGQTQLDNLCLTCRGCNSFKLDFQTGIDPESQDEVSLFNPRTQTWSDHFRWNADGTLIVGLSPSGRATVSRLRMNREAVVAARHLWVEAGWHPPQVNHFPTN